MKSLKPNKAFSITELSVTIILTSLLIVSVFFGTKLIKNANTISARATTQSSPIWNILDEDGTNSAAIWLDATEAGSLSTTYYNNESRVLQWRGKMGGVGMAPDHTTYVSSPLYNTDGEYSAVYFLGSWYDDGRPIRYGDDLTSIKVSPNPINNEQTFSVGIVFKADVDDKSKVRNDCLTSVENIAVSMLFSTSVEERNVAPNLIINLNGTQNTCKIKFFGEGALPATLPAGDDVLFRPNAINSLIFTADFSKTEDHLQVYSNGTKTTLSFTGANSVEGKHSLSGNRLEIGRSNIDNLAFKGKVYEFVVFKSTLSPQEVLSVQKYFMSKYQIN